MVLTGFEPNEIRWIDTSESINKLIREVRLAGFRRNCAPECYLRLMVAKFATQIKENAK